LRFSRARCHACRFSAKAARKSSASKETELEEERKRKMKKISVDDDSVFFTLLLSPLSQKEQNSEEDSFFSRAEFSRVPTSFPPSFAPRCSSIHTRIAEHKEPHRRSRKQDRKAG